jgi:hypothetical protein
VEDVKISDAHQAYEFGLSAMKARLQAYLSFVLPPVKQLKKPKNQEWYGSLRKVRDLEEALLDHSNRDRAEVSAQLRRGVEKAYADLLPKELTSARFFNEVSKGCQSFSLTPPQDRRIKLRSDLNAAASSLLTVQKRSAMPGLFWWMILTASCVGIAGGLAYLLYEGMIGAAIYAIVTSLCCLMGLVALGMLYAGNKSERGRSVERLSGKVSEAWNLLRQNAIDVVAYEQFISALSDLGAQADEYATNNRLKAKHVSIAAQRNEAAQDPSLDAVRDTHLFKGRLPEGGRHRVSLIAGRQVVAAIRNWTIVDPEANVQAFATYLKGEATALHQWLGADGDNAFHLFESWLVSQNRYALKERDCWQAYQLDVTAGHGRIQHLVERDAGPATKARRGRVKSRVFAVSGHQELLREVAKLFEADVVADNNRDELRLLVLGERQYTGPELLMACEYSRDVLADGSFWKFMPSPIIERLVRASGMIERARFGNRPATNAAEEPAIAAVQQVPVPALEGASEDGARPSDLGAP